MRRMWFIPTRFSLSPEECLQLKNRTLAFSRRRAEYLRAFIDGYKTAKE